jgi:hypothetical protein
MQTLERHLQHNGNCSEEEEDRGLEFTALRRLLVDTVQSYPMSAHREFEAFFAQGIPSAGTTSSASKSGKDTGDADEKAKDEPGLQNVRKAWARAVVKTQAFSRKSDSLNMNTSKISDPVSFGEDVISDLSLPKNEYSRVVTDAERLIANINKSLGHKDILPGRGKSAPKAEVLSNEEIYSSLASIVRIGEELQHLNSLLNSAGISDTTSLFSAGSGIGAESTVEFRQWARRMKPHWNSQMRLNVHYATFAPVNLQLLGPADTVFGVSNTGGGDDHHSTKASTSSAWAADVDHVCGVRIVSKSRGVTTRAWVSYDCYTKFSVGRLFNIFPVALRLDRDPASMLMVFEAPSARPLYKLMNPLLCSYLYRSPIILRLCKISRSICDLLCFHFPIVFQGAAN